MWLREQAMRASRALLLTAITVLASSCDAPLVHAEPTVFMAWNSCNPSSLRYDYVTRELLTDGQLQIWVLGQTSGSEGYSLDLELWSPDGDHIADAWRFDPAGCQPESLLSFIFMNPTPSAQSCGHGLNEFSSPHSVVFENEYDSVARRTRVHIEVRYSPPTTTINPNERYRLARLYFTQSSRSVFGTASNPGECGGLEQPVCFRITDARYQDPDGQWIAWPIDGTPVTAHGEGTLVPECGTIPVRATSWGVVKATYR